MTKKALITGASRGIGRATVELFFKAGWDLFLISRNEKAIKALANDLSTDDRPINYQAIDFSDPHDLSAGLKSIKNKLEEFKPSVLINNAGVAWTGDLLEMPLNDWQWIMQMNLTSVFQVCSLVVPLMREEGGLVVNVSSHASRNAFSQWGAYCISKAALASFTKCLGEEERQNSIRATTITLGAVNTPLWDEKTVESDFDRNAMLEPESVASVILNLATQPSSQCIEDITLMPAKGVF